MDGDVRKISAHRQTQGIRGAQHALWAVDEQQVRGLRLCRCEFNVICMGCDILQHGHRTSFHEIGNSDGFARRAQGLFQPGHVVPPAEFIADLPEMGGIAVADGAVESEGQLVCGCDDGEDLSAALPAQQLLYAGIELPPDAAVLGFVGEIAGNFGVPRVGSALKGAPA